MKNKRTNHNRFAENSRFSEKGAAGGEQAAAKGRTPKKKSGGRNGRVRKPQAAQESTRIRSDETEAVPKDYQQPHSEKSVMVRGMRIGEGMPKICVPVVGSTVDEILRQAGEIMFSPADLVEWRADHFRRVDDNKAVIAALKKLNARLEEKPVLFTFRTAAEGGEREFTKEQYRSLYEAVIASGYADIVDIEYSLGTGLPERLIDLAKAHGVTVILSYHDFSATPPEDEILSRLEAMRNMGADIAKIAVMPQTPRDVLSLLSASERLKSESYPIPVIAISMSAMGIVSRISGEVFGSAVTFAAAGKSSAPGQIDADEVDRLLGAIHRGTDHASVRGTAAAGKKNAILIGFMGSGKTTVAKKLAQKTGLEVKEIDDMIVAQEGMPIKNIFDKYGEAYFRDVETQQAKIISESDGVIVSCGGGTVMRRENVEYLKKNGTIILLQATSDTVFERVKRGGDKRPLLNKYMARGYISWLMKKRNDAYYAAADVVIYTDGMTSDRVADEIIKIMDLKRS